MLNATIIKFEDKNVVLGICSLCSFEAKIFDDAYMYGFQDGRIRSLKIMDSIGQVIVHYNEGAWLMETNKSTVLVYNAVVELLLSKKYLMQKLCWLYGTPVPAGFNENEHSILAWEEMIATQKIKLSKK